MKIVDNQKTQITPFVMLNPGDVFRHTITNELYMKLAPFDVTGHGVRIDAAVNLIDGEIISCNKMNVIPLKATLTIEHREGVDND